LRRYHFRDNTRNVHGTLNPVLDLSPRLMAHAVTSTISRPVHRVSSKPANDSYLFHLRRNRTHTIPQDHMVLYGETLRAIENASEMWRRPYSSFSWSPWENIREHYDFVVVMHMWSGHYYCMFMFQIPSFRHQVHMPKM